MFRAVWVLLGSVVFGAWLPAMSQGKPRPAARAVAPARNAAAESDSSARFAGEPVVAERWDTVYQYKADGTGVKTDTEVLLAQTDAGAHALSVLTVPYQATRQQVEVVYARVRKRNGTTVATPPGDAQDEPTALTRALPAYSDTHLLRLALRGLAAGDRLEYQVRTVLTAPQAKGEFWGFEQLRPGRGVVVERTVELRMPAGTHLLVGTRGPAAVLHEEPGQKVYRWVTAQTVPSVKAPVPGQAAAEGTALEGGAEPQRLVWSTFASWAAVGDWYRGETAGRTAVTPDLQAKADEVVYGARTPDARLAALYGYVAGKIQTINVPLGAAGYQPRSASEVLANQYGDSGDKAILLAALLHAEKLPAAAVLAGSGEDVDETVPAPMWFERVLTLSHDSEHGDVWLDTVPEAAPYRLLPQPLRGKMALVIPESGAATLRRTPAEAPFAEYTHFTATGELDAEGSLRMHVDEELRGDEEMRYGDSLRAAGPVGWDQAVGQLVRQTGMRGEVSHVTVDGLQSTQTPLRVGFDFVQATQLDWEHFRVVPPEPGMLLPLVERRTAPGGEFSLGGKRTETAVTRLTLPAGLGADVPAPVHLVEPFATLDKTYRVEDGKAARVLVTERSLVVKQDSLPASGWPAYRKFLDAAAKTEPFVQLVSLKAHPGPGHFAPMAGETNTAASALISQANEAVGRRDWAKATARLDEAKVLNPRQALLWSTYAGVAQGQGRPDEAIADDRQELKEHPAESEVSRHLAALLLRAGKPAEAEAVLRAALAADPGDEAARRMLTDQLLPTDPGAAETMLRDALRTAPQDLAIKLELGRVLLREGKRDEAAALLSAVAQGSENPEQVNDAAYELAEASMNLRVAEQAAQRAVRMLNAEASRGIADGMDRQALLRSAQLVSAWDTYGWVLLKEGSTSEAEPWLRAAWQDSQGALAGAHYARLLSKEGRAAEAAQVQAQASRGEQGRVAQAADGAVQGARPAATAGRRGGREKPESGRAAQASAGAISAVGASGFSVPRPAGGPAGTAVFDVDLGLGYVPAVRFVRGDARLAGLADAVAKVDAHLLIPPGSAGHLVRRAEVVCEDEEVACRMRLMPISEALAP